MGRVERSQKRNSLITHSQGYSVKAFASLISFAVGVSALTACHTDIKKIPLNPSTSIPVVTTLPPVELNAKVSARALTSTGDNSQARFSTDGKQILYISKKRPNHEQAQVYLLDIEKKTERRLTFHDGDDERPTWGPGDLFIFASSTDERKETPHVVDRLLRRYRQEAIKDGTPVINEGTELYEQTLAGRSIERLTKNPGTDTGPVFDFKKKRIIFISNRDGSENIYSLNSRSLGRLTNGKFSDDSPQLSADGTYMVWSRKEAGSLATHLILAPVAPPLEMKKKMQILTGGDFTDLNPSWNQSGDLIVFSSNRGGKYYNLFSIDRAGTCLKQLTDIKDDIYDPVVSPDGKKVGFTLARFGKSRQVYLIDSLANLDGTCQPPIPVPVPTPPPPIPSPAPTPSSSPAPEK